MQPPIFGFYDCIAFTILSLPLYVVIIIFLVRNRNCVPYDSAFFKLWLALAFVDILSDANSFLVSDSINYGYIGSIFDSSTLTFIAAFGTTTANFYYLSQMALNLMISINRYTAIARPTDHQSIWRKANTYRIIAVSFVFSVICSAPHFATSYILLWNNQTDSYIVYYGNNIIPVMMTIIKAIVGTIASVISIFCYFFAIRKYRNSYREMHQNNKLALQSNAKQQTTNDIEWRLLICGLLTFITMIVTVCWNIILLIILWTGNSVKYGVVAIISWAYIRTLFCSLNPFTLMFCSTTMRTSLFSPIVHYLKSIRKPNNAIDNIEMTPMNNLVRVE